MLTQSSIVVSAISTFRQLLMFHVIMLLQHMHFSVGVLVTFHIKDKCVLFQFTFTTLEDTIARSPYQGTKHHIFKILHFQA